MIVGFNHIKLQVADLTESVRFYSDLLGFQRGPEFRDEQGNITGSLDEMGWIDRKHALVRISGKPGRAYWYRFTLPLLCWQKIPPPRRPTFLADCEQPFYDTGS